MPALGIAPTADDSGAGQVDLADVFDLARYGFLRDIGCPGLGFRHEVIGNYIQVGR